MTHLEVVRQVYEAFASQDLDRLISLADPKCVITQDASLPWGGRHTGHEGVTAFALALVGTSESELTIESLFEADGKVIQTGRTKGLVRANGAKFDIPEVHIWTISNGKVIEVQFAIDTPAMLQAIAQPSNIKN